MRRFDVVVALYVAFMTLRGKKDGAQAAAPERKLAARNRKGAAR